MIKSGILNPQIASLLARVRHTNTVVIADRGFPNWPDVETIDISLVDNVPTTLDVLRAILANYVIGQAWMAEEFRTANDAQTLAAYATVLEGVHIAYECHCDLKRRVPAAIGLIRTGDATQFANIVLQSA